MNNVSGTSFGCGHCRDAVSKFVKEGVPVDAAKRVVKAASGGTENCYSEAHSYKARKFDFGLMLHPEKFQAKVAELKAASGVDVKA